MEERGTFETLIKVGQTSLSTRHIKVRKFVLHCYLFLMFIQKRNIKLFVIIAITHESFKSYNKI
jgi:hypothetical protein